MRISTNQIFQTGLDGMLRQQLETLRLQQQLSSGKKIDSPADDPIAASLIAMMKQRLDWTDNLQKNADSSASSLAFEESILDNTVIAVQRIRELQVQAGNSALSESDRNAMSKEMENLLSQLENLGNTRDSNGSYLFAGGKTSTTPFTKDMTGAYVYNGDETQRFQTVASGLQIPVNDHGNDIFMRITNGNGFFTVSQTGNTGAASATTGSLVDPVSYVPDDYTVSFVLNSSSELVMMVTGAVAGNIIPPTGIPDDAPLYQNGMSADFMGIEIAFKGTPEAGDSFAIRPAENESLFSTTQRIIANLKQPFTTAAHKAAVETENNQLMEQLDSAINNLIIAEARVGARRNQIDISSQVNGDVVESSTNSLQLLEDANLAEAAVSLNLQMVFLQASQQSFSRIQGLSIFNYI